MDEQPNITVGICENREFIAGSFDGHFRGPDGAVLSGSFRAAAEGDTVAITDGSGPEVLRSGAVSYISEGESVFSLEGVTIGRSFHWERRQKQTFEGSLTLVAEPRGGITAINTLPLETYLTSVISSEMSSAAPPEFLKAHAIISRSWLGAMLAKKSRGEEAGGHRASDVSFAGQQATGASAAGATLRGCGSGTAYDPKAGNCGRIEHGDRSLGEDEIIRWYDREDHEGFDVCADDHCQRYQGIGQRGRAAEAVAATRGMFLMHGGEVCDARYHKACGGLTELFGTAWEDMEVPYLASISDGPAPFPPADSEDAARAWLLSRPDAYCRVDDRELLARILPAYDQETADFFRWQVIYERGRLEELIREKSGIDFGTLRALVPAARGPSGRLHRLRIVGSRRTAVVGKELEIRRWLSPSHLLSSAFIVHTEGGTDGAPVRFILHGAGWGHGVGLCQIGAAAMAERGFTAEAILAHYFPGTTLEKRYP